MSRVTFLPSEATEDQPLIVSELETREGDVAIRFGLHLSGAPDPLDPEATEVIGLFALWFTYSIVVGVCLMTMFVLWKRLVK